MAFDYTNYYELEYVETSKAQRLDTGVPVLSSAYSSFEFTYDFQPKTIDYNYNSLYCVNQNATTFEAWIPNTGNIRVRAGSVVFADYSANTSRREIKVSRSSGTVSFYDSLTQNTYTQTYALTNTYNLKLCGKTDNSFGNAYVYGATVTTDNTLVRNFVPAERISDGVAGFYDVVYGVFYTSDTSTDFIAGPRVIPCVITTDVYPSGAGTVTGGGTYSQGSSVVLTATANVGYAFSQWDDGNTDNPRTITVTGDATYTAQFVVPQLRTITLNTTPAGAGTVSGGGQYYDGTVITISATANDGFAFDEWSDGDTNNPRTLTVNSDLTLTAIFKITGVLPKRYIPMTSLGGTNVYFDTGVYPTNDTNIECAFYVDESYDSYLFGARNTNSNTSAGQLNCLAAPTSYLGFASTRYSLGSYNSYGYMFLTNEDNEFLMNYRGEYLKEVTGATTTFTGTQPIYILAMNNGGSVNYGSNPFCFVARFAISQGGTKIKDYYPVYDTQTSQFGLYDFVNDAFLSASGSGSFQTTHLLEIRSSVGGNAYMEMPFGEVQKIYMTPTRYFNGKTFVWKLYSPIKAVADEGYGFLNWTDQDGNVYSTEEEIVGNAEFTQDMVITANFVKKTDVLQTNPFQLMGIRYGIPARIAQEDVRKDDFYTFIESFSINEDSLNKTTSTIVCRTIPSIYQTNMPVVLYDNFGRMVWAGMIESIDGNTLTCREPLATYDEEFMFTQTSSFVYNGYALSNFVILEALYLYFMRSNMLPTSDWDLATNNYNPLTSRKRLAVTTTVLSEANLISYDKTGNIFTTLPEISERSIGNMEEYLFEIINQFGIGYKTSVLLTDYSHTISVTLTNPLLYKTLVLGDNNDFISNIQVTSEMQEDNVLIIFNEAGTSVRGQYGMRTDGTVKKVPGALADADNPNFIGWQNCKAKVVMSDDNINTLIAQYLTNSMYNHKITFDIELNNRLVRLDDFKMGRRVEFHIGDKLYHSIVTGRSYSLAENEKEIHRATITLGNVRTSLTSKLNLGKVK